MPVNIIKENKIQTEILGVPIFKTGKHNGGDYSIEDLNKMVENYQELKRENPDFQIPIKIGHDSDNSLERPAVGWMENIRVCDDMLVADFKEMVPWIIDDIKNKSFKNRSVEIITKFVNSAGKKLGYVIKGIALLGSSLPAVNLPDIKFHLIPESILNFGIGQASKNIDFEEELLQIDFQFIKSMEPHMGIQTLIFDKSIFKKEEAVSWAEEHHFKNDKIDETEDSFRFRQQDPADFEKASFKTIDFKKGIKAVIGKLITSQDKIDKEEKIMAVEIETVEKKEEIQEKPQKKTEAEVKAFALIEEIKKFSDDPNKVIKFFQEYEEAKKRFETEQEKMVFERKERSKRELNEFTNKLIESDQLLPAERQLVDVLLFNLDSENSVEFSYSEYNVKDKKTLLEIFKMFLSNLPKRGILGQAGSSKLVLGWKQGLQEFAYSKGYKETLEKMDSKTWAQLYSEHKKLRPDLYEGGE